MLHLAALTDSGLVPGVDARESWRSREVVDRRTVERSETMTCGFEISRAGRLDFLSLGALVIRLEEGAGSHPQGA